VVQIELQKDSNLEQDRKKKLEEFQWIQGRQGHLENLIKKQIEETSEFLQHLQQFI